MILQKHNAWKKIPMNTYILKISRKKITRKKWIYFQTYTDHQERNTKEENLNIPIMNNVSKKSLGFDGFVAKISTNHFKMCNNPSYTLPKYRKEILLGSYKERQGNYKKKIQIKCLGECT